MQEKLENVFKFESTGEKNLSLVLDPKCHYNRVQITDGFTI